MIGICQIIHNLSYVDPDTRVAYWQRWAGFHYWFTYRSANWRHGR